MKILIKILILLFITSCNNTKTEEKIDFNKKDSTNLEFVEKVKIESQQLSKTPLGNFLNYIDIVNEIEITHTDDKYGEWGGDTELILIYSNGDEFFANYHRYLGSVDPQLPPKKNGKLKKWYEYKKLEFKIDSIKLTHSDKELIEKTILELLKNKLRNPNAFAHAGIFNSIVSKDSTLVIYDYPSIEWEHFQKLKKELKSR